MPGADPVMDRHRARPNINFMMIETINKALFQITKYVAWLGMAFLLGAMFITSTDVVLRKVDSAGIYGTIDLIQLMIISAAYLAIPHAFMNRSHVAVSIAADLFSRRGLALCNLIAAILACVFMIAIAWNGYSQARTQYQYGDISITLGLPMIYYWVPLLFGAGLSALVTLHMAIESIYTIITGRGALTPELE